MINHDESSVKIPQAQRWESFQAGEHVEARGGWCTRSGHPSSTCLPTHLFIWLSICIPYYILYDKPVNKYFPEFCELF